MKNRTSITFIEELLVQVPELQRLYEEHVDDYDEPLPHVFFGDVTRFAVSATDDDWKRDVLARLLKKLESGLTNGSAEVKDLVIASFVENLCGETTAIEILRPLMGPSLRAQVKATCGE